MKMTKFVLTIQTFSTRAQFTLVFHKGMMRGKKAKHAVTFESAHDLPKSSVR